jgi:hypothetical protein
MRWRTLAPAVSVGLVVACGGSGGTGHGGAGTTANTSSAGGATTGSGTTAGGTTSTGAGGGCTTHPTFTEVLAGPLSGCAGFEPPCHNANAGNLNINPQMKAATWAQLVNVPTYTSGAGIRVVPGNAAKSFLYRKLTGDLSPTEGSPMPKPPAISLFDAGWMELPAADIEMVRCWIQSGAADD